jgi:hypothetical protein
MKNIFESIAREIEEIDRKWRAVIGEALANVVLPARWSYFGGALRWHVPIGEEVLETDVDIEITSVMLIVRARSARDESKVFIGLLPVPGSFDVSNPEFQFESNTLEVVLYPIGGDER